MTNDKIHKRGLTSFFTLFGFLIMSITGLVLYVVPAGRIAFWTDWELLGMSKTQWGNIHILSSILFIVAGAFHIYFNWKPLINYFKSRAAKTVKLKRELAISGLISILITVSAIFSIPPLSYLLDFNEFIKETWIIEDDYEPPFGHAELLTLNTFTKKMDIDTDQAKAELKEKGIRFESGEETLEDIAKNNNTSPMNIYLLIKKFEPTPQPKKLKSYTPETVELEFSGTNLGNKSLSAICENLGLDSPIVLDRLESLGIEATTDETLKKIAEKHNTAPIELLKAIIIEGYTPKN
jgi:hypothetical protein